jgi:glycosyltransferase involved in cell wall biosynthesis
VVKRVTVAVPGDLATRTGGYAYDRRIVAELRQAGWQVDVLELGDGFPMPDAATMRAAEAKLAAAPAGSPLVIDGLAFGVLPDAAAALRGRLRVVALVHHPLALETGLSATQSAALRESERAALACADAVIATSAATARMLVTDYAVAGERIAVAPPGTDRSAAMATGRADGVVRLLSVGAVVPRKGFDILIAALATLTDLPWRLVIAGDITRDAATVARLDADIAARGLGGRIEVLGAVDDERLDALYAAADVFVLASRFEGYGMAYAEAIARGLPVIGTTGGAIPDTVPAEAGVLVPPDDAAALARALRRVVGSAEDRRQLAAGAKRASAALPTWRSSAQMFAAALEGAG